MSRDSVAGMATGYGLGNRGVGVRVPVESTSSRSAVVHPTSYPMCAVGSFPGVKQWGHETNHSPPASAKVKKMWICTSISPYAFMA
jgi:hypothetical protein